MENWQIKWKYTAGCKCEELKGHNVDLYSEEAVANSVSEKGFIIQRLDGAEPEQGLPVYEFNGQRFEIIPVQKP